MKILKKIIIALIFFIIILTLIFLWKNNSTKNTNFIKARIGNKIFTLEVADNEELIFSGLSGRKSLPKNRGMLFVLDKKFKYSFWMKGMNFALDFIWVKDNEIKDISENIQPPEADNLRDLPILTTRESIDRVIEVNAGIVEELKINIGDKIEFIPTSPR